VEGGGDILLRRHRARQPCRGTEGRGKRATGASWCYGAARSGRTPVVAGSLSYSNLNPARWSPFSPSL
jgi:hypothetical protein